MYTAILNGANEEHRIDVKENNYTEYMGVSGRVLDEAERGIYSACVKIVDGDYQPICHVLTDCNGRFQLVSRPVHQIKLIVSAPKFETKVVHYVQETMEISLSSQASIYFGKVVYREDVPPSVVEVTLQNQGMCQKTYTQADGIFLFRGVVPGNYSLIFSGNHCDRQVFSATVVQGGQHSNLGIFPVKIRDMKGTIHGLITDTEGQPIGGALVLLWEGEQQRAHTLSNEEGVYFFGNVPLGKYHISVYQ